MARAERAKKFWTTIKGVSVKAIVAESQRPFALALAGPPGKREEALRYLFPSIHLEEVIPERSLVRAFDSLTAADGFPRDAGSFDLVIDAGSPRTSHTDAPPGTPVFSLHELGEWPALMHRILDERPDLALSLGRRFPGLREEVARRVIQDTAVANAEFAMLSALPGVIPVLGALLPAGAIGDIFMLTKNQAMMLFRLAALYELPLDASSRARDLGPLLGNAFGWRAIAREVIGAVPGGIGLVARGTIAFAGTVALGRGIERLYRTGSQPTRAQIAAFYREAYSGARERIQAIARRITARRPRQIPK